MAYAFTEPLSSAAPVAEPRLSRRRASARRADIPERQTCVTKRRLLPLGSVPQQGQQVQANHMRNALLILRRMLAPDLTAERASDSQFKRRLVPRHRITPGLIHPLE